MSALEETLLHLIREDGLPEPMREYAFAAGIGACSGSRLAW